MAKLSDEEEQLLREFEQDRLKKKEALAEEVQKLMVREADGGVEEDINREVEKEVEKKVEAAAASPDVDPEALRKEIEAQTRQELEEKIRKEIEEKEKKKKEALLLEMRNLKEEEDKMRAQLELEIRKKVELELAEEAKKSVKQQENAMKEKFLELRRIEEEEMRNKIKEEVKKEMEDERNKKKEALMKKIETVKKESDEITNGKKGLEQNDKIVITQLFEESQKVFQTFLSTRLDKKDTDIMFAKGLMAAARKYPDVLKRTMYDKQGNLRAGGVLDASRLMANVNMLPLPEEKKGTRFFEALRTIFEERVILCEMATSNDIKNKIVSDVLNQMDKVLKKRGYSPKITSIFMKQVFPDTGIHGGR